MVGGHLIFGTARHEKSQGTYIGKGVTYNTWCKQI